MSYPCTVSDAKAAIKAVEDSNQSASNPKAPTATLQPKYSVKASTDSLKRGKE